MSPAVERYVQALAEKAAADRAADAAAQAARERYARLAPAERTEFEELRAQLGADVRGTP